MNHYNYIPKRDPSDQKPSSVAASASVPSSNSGPNIWYCPSCRQFYRNPGRAKNLACGSCGSSLEETSMSQKDYDAKTTEEKEQWKKEYAASHLPLASAPKHEEPAGMYHPNNWANVILFAGWFFLAIVAIGAIIMLFEGQIFPAIVTALGGLLLVSGFMMFAEMAQDLRRIRYYMDEQADRRP